MQNWRADVHFDDGFKEEKSLCFVGGIIFVF
jgi:hypothetical protein